jgi:hypothetical protein
MTVSFSFSPETLARLRERAEAEGKPVEVLIREVVEQTLGREQTQNNPPRELTPEEWCARFHAWASGHPPVDWYVDDSRESIYAGRAE